ncbi:TPA: hypothetical protein HA259_05445 [Thermoplasmata archaeon]|nr:hypothetical protein [Thermoplasmata archaeon]
MVFGLRSRSAQDGQAQPETRRTPYRLASYEHDYEGKKFKSSTVVYSFWSASKYTLILSIVLWWLPLFGQMIAGYVGGRRAGGPWKGVAAAIIPVACLYIVLTGFDSGFFPSHVLGVAIAPAAVSASLSESIPFISPYIQFSSEYLGSFVSALAGASPYGINTYVVTVAFAYVGGILAEQSRREIEYNSGNVMSNTTVLVHDNGKEQRFHPYPEPARPGLAHMISSHLPWSHAGHGSHQHVYALPPARAAGAKGWQYANRAAFENVNGARPGEPPAQVIDVEPASAAHRKSGGRSHKSGPKQRSSRRTRQHYSSSRRFSNGPSAPSLAGPVRSRGTSRHRGDAPRSRSSSLRFAPSDQKSVKRARKAIEREWGSRSRFTAPQRRTPVEFVDDEDFVEPASSAPSRQSARGHERHPQKQRWDTI